MVKVTQSSLFGVQGVSYRSRLVSQGMDRKFKVSLAEGKSATPILEFVRFTIGIATDKGA